MSHTCSTSTIDDHLPKCSTNNITVDFFSIIINEHDQTYCGVEAGWRGSIDSYSVFPGN